MKLTSKAYADYLALAYERIHEQEEYVTDLDLATGDGDHWANLNKGFAKLAQMRDELAELTLDELFKKVGMTMMAVIGGSSGVLYGGAYVAASKALSGVEALDLAKLAEVLDIMLNDIMMRGRAQRGWKTMIDALAPAVDALKLGVDDGAPETSAIAAMVQAAKHGAEATKGMEAIRGRANYQADKGIGHLDPGAVTMAIQLEALGEVALGTI